MQIKGIIKWLVLILGLACIWQLSFSFVTRNIEAKADAQTEKDPKTYLNEMWDQKVYFGYTYGECKARELNLGLDLKGGMNVTLEIQAGNAIRAHALDDKRAGKSDAELIARIDKAIAKANAEEAKDAESRATEGEDAKNVIEVYLENMNKADLETIYGTSDAGKIGDDLLAYVKSSVENMHRVLGERIDLLGVVQPNIQQIRGTNRILVELPGVDDPENAAKLLASTANLEFWEVCDDSMSNALTSFLYLEADALVNDYYANVLEQEAPVSFRSLLKESYPMKNQEGKVVEFPVGGMIVAAADKESMKQIDEYFNIETVRARLDEITNGEVKLAWSNKSSLESSRDGVFMLYALQGRGGMVPAMDGSGITNARAVGGQFGGYEVSMSMDHRSAIEWGNLTEANIGKPLAIVMDDVVYSAPNVKGRIDGGQSSISGNFTPKEAEDLANVLQSGKVPAPATIISYEVVGPSLGADSIAAGMISFILAFVLVLIYMIFFYKTAGWMANIALLFNVLLLMGVLVSTGAVLTLPGIAGIVLTMGMAVDANVIIFERIKEELRGGKGLALAIKDGFKNAYSAIIDGNLTTIITGAVLFFFGTGPVKGFATTLVLGIITSLFCSIFVTRVLLEWWANRRGTLDFSTKLTENFLKNVKFSFIDKRKYSYILSGVLIVASIISFCTIGFNLGIDFTGGRQYVVKFDQTVSEDALRKNLDAEFKQFSDAANTSFEVMRIGAADDNKIRIKTQFEPNADMVAAAKAEAAEAGMSQEDIDKINENYVLEQVLYNATDELFKEEISFDQFRSTKDDERGIESGQKVGSSISTEMTKNSFIAVLISLVAIGLYIAIRFRRWQWALGATLALVHNALLVIGIFSMLYAVMPFTMEVNQAFIAAILTIIGYSINDTVVIFDRIREYIGLYPKRDIKTNIDNAICATLSRTINTSGTTLVTLLSIFIFGGETIRGFVFALIVGVIIGTYSSVFVATPIAYDCQRKKAAKEAAQAE